MDDVKQLLDEVRTGIDIETFLRSAPGQIFKTKCDDYVATKIEELITHSPYDCDHMATLQQEIRFARNAVLWLVETVIAGQNAEHFLKLRDSE